MKSLLILVEYREPQNEEEAGLYGLCNTEDHRIARIFINSNKEPDSRIDTFFHEVTHAFCHWRREKSGSRAERIATMVGNAADNVFREVFK